MNDYNMVRAVGSYGVRVWAGILLVSLLTVTACGNREATKERDGYDRTEAMYKDYHVIIPEIREIPLAPDDTGTENVDVSDIKEVIADVKYYEDIRIDTVDIMIDGMGEVSGDTDPGCPNDNGTDEKEPADYVQADDRACVPKTCAEIDKECGNYGNGCAGSLDCGECGGHQTCEAGKCVDQPYCGDKQCNNNETCHSCVTDCGACCGNEICEPGYGENCKTCKTDCGCGSGQVCDAGSCCTPKTCDSMNWGCGSGSDGCAGSLDCGTCPQGQTCDQGNHTCHASMLSYAFWPYWVGPSWYQPNWNGITHVAYSALHAKADGSLDTQDMDNYTAVYTEAKKHGVKVILSIDCFDQNIQNQIFAYHRSDLANNILNAIKTYGADGVNIDFEFPMTNNPYIPYTNKFLFEDVMYHIFATLNYPEHKYHVSFCVAYSVEDEFRNANLNGYVDNVFFMGYDYHLDGSAVTGAIAPFNDPEQFDVKDSLNILYNYFSKNKLILGVPFYGRDWPAVSNLPGTKTTGNAIVLLMKTAMENAPTYGRKWDSGSNTPWYTYQNSGEWRQVWYEDTQSLTIKWDYAIKEGLAGTGYWALGGEAPSIWNVIIKKFR